MLSLSVDNSFESLTIQGTLVAVAKSLFPAIPSSCQHSEHHPRLQLLDKLAATGDVESGRIHELGESCITVPVYSMARLKPHIASRWLVIWAFRGIVRVIYSVTGIIRVRRGGAARSDDANHIEFH